MTRRGPHRLSAGFTLVELLVALFVTAIIFAMGYGAINEALANREVVKAQQERLTAVQTAVRVLTQDFTQVAPRPVREPIGDGWQPAIIALDEDAERLVVFTRAGWANPAGVQRPALQRVAYEFKDNTLARLHWPVLDTPSTDQTVRRDLLKQVRSVKFRFMDSGRQWHENWPAQRNNSTPQMAFRQRPIAVEVTLELEDWGEVVRIIEVPT
jgi:general secretion pathway protein J